MHVKTMNAHSVLKISKKSHFYFSFLYVLSFGARIQMSFIRKRCLEKNKPQLLKVQTNVMLHTTDQKYGSMYCKSNIQLFICNLNDLCKEDNQLYVCIS